MLHKIKAILHSHKHSGKAIFSHKLQNNFNSKGLHTVSSLEETLYCLKENPKMKVIYEFSIIQWLRLLIECTQFSSVQFSCSVESDSATPWTAACKASLFITNSQSLLKLMSNESVMLSNHLILCRPLLLQPSILPSIRVFSNESALLIRWPKYWSFSYSISPSSEYSGLISFRMDWFYLLAVQGTLFSNTTVQKHQFFYAQLSLVQLYTTAGKIIALTRWTFAGKVMSLFFNTLSRLVITLLPRSKSLLISWLQSPSAVILEPPKIKAMFPLFLHLIAMKWWDRMRWS